MHGTKEGERWPEATPNKPCPICSKARRCKVEPDGNAAHCFRSTVAPVGWRLLKSSPSGCTFVRDDTPNTGRRRSKKKTAVATAAQPSPSETVMGPITEPPPEPAPAPILTADVRHQIYSELLALLGFNDEDRQDMLNRGYTAEELDLCGFASKVPGKATLQCTHLCNKYGPTLFNSVPGLTYGGLGMINCGGILVPYRDLAGRITALQLRLYKPNKDGPKYIWISSVTKSHPNAPSPGSPVHIPLLFKAESPRKALTEGGIKADLATKYWLSTVGVAGVAMWRRAIPILLETSTRIVVVTFDADASTNPEVAVHLLTCVQGLIGEGFDVELARWDIADGKGIDDLLRAGKQPEILVGDAAVTAAREIAKAAGVDLLKVQRHDVDSTKSGDTTIAQGDESHSKDAKTGVPSPSPPKPVVFTQFPTETLPEPVRTFVRASAAALVCDESFIALPLLATLANSVGNSRRICLKRSWCEPCVLWTVIIGESGTTKSPALDQSLVFLRKIEAAHSREHREAMDRFDRDYQLYEADHANWKSKGRKANEPPPEKPTAPICVRYTAEDTTVEALASLLENQPRGLLVARDELSGWLNSFDAYKSTRGADVATWLSMHRAGCVNIDRKTNKRTTRISHAAVSVTGGVQPATLRSALAGRYAANGLDEAMDKPRNEHFENGLAARLLLSMPPRRPKQWTDDDIDESISATMHQLFASLLALEMTNDENGDLQPLDLPLTPAAKKIFVRFYNEHGKEQCLLTGDLAAAWSKIEGYAPRFALLFHLIRCAANDPSITTTDAVDELCMAAGIEIARWFGDEAARVYGELGGEAEPEADQKNREHQRLINWIRDHGGKATARDVTRGLRQYRGKPDAAEATLCALVKAEVGTWSPTTTSSRGGHPTRTFILVTGGDSDETHSKPGESSGNVALDQSCVTTSNGELGADAPTEEVEWVA
jgi:hypothetical protein